MKPFFSFLLFIIAQEAFTQTNGTTQKEDTLPTASMKTVVISAAKKPIEIYPDKTVLNIDASPAAIGQNALEVLRQAPGVAVDAAENIQLGGKAGVTVLIDGKNTQLSSQDLAQFLKSIEAGNIKQVEIISNPSAKYDAASNAGIINIKLKKSLTNGFNGNLSGSYVQSNHARESSSGNFNWRTGKVNLFFNGGWNNGLQHTIANNDRNSNGLLFTQRSTEKDAFHGNSIRTGIDYKLNKKNTIGLLWMQNNKYTKMDNNSTTLIQAPRLADTTIATRSIAPFNTARNSINLNYVYAATAIDYAMDVDYTQFHSSVNNLLQNNFINSAGMKYGSNATQNDQRVAIKLASVKGDFAKTISSSIKLEAGYKWMQTKTDNSLQVLNEERAAWLQDTGKTNFFNYQEAITAAYISVRGKSKKLSWQGGLRAEHTTVQGRSTDLKNTLTTNPDTSYTTIFPTLFLQYQLSPKSSVALSANRRIDRPGYQDQNPFIYALDAFNSEQGNPYLMPQFTNSIEAGYSYNYATSFKINYLKTTDYIESLTYTADKGTVQIPQNAGTRQMLNFIFSIPLQIIKWWTVYASATPYYHQYKTIIRGYGIDETQQAGSWGFNGYGSNTFKLGKGWKGDVSGWFNFQNRATIYTSKPLGSVNIGVQKNLLKDAATLKFSVVDLFNTQRWEQRATTSFLSLNTYRKWESQNITLGFSWRFGNTKIKRERERQTGSEEDANRIK